MANAGHNVRRVSSSGKRTVSKTVNGGSIPSTRATVSWAAILAALFSLFGVISMLVWLVNGADWLYVGAFWELTALVWALLALGDDRK